jgi:hypothetical protein
MIYKFKVIAEMEMPKNMSELCTALGSLQYLRRFVQNFGTIGGPFICFIKCDDAWFWGPEQEKSFNTLKSMVSKAPMLPFYNVECETRRAREQWS